MKTRQVVTIFLVCLLIISGVIGLAACATLPLAGQQGSVDAQLNTAVAATVVKYLVETKVAAQALAMAVDPAAQTAQAPAPTATPVVDTPAPPTATALPPTLPPAEPPTATPLPAGPAVAKPEIRADANTNCRTGPSTAYGIASYFAKGAVTTVEGRDAGKDWWYIPNPANDGDFCWVWDGSTTVIGDTSQVAVIPAPSTGKVSNTYNPYGCCNTTCGWSNGCGWNNTCNNNCWPSGTGCGWNNCGCDWNNCGWNTCGCYNSTNWCGAWNCCWNTGAGNWCKCDPVTGKCTCKNPYKQSGCPAITEVNYKNYCTKYPKCCK